MVLRRSLPSCVLLVAVTGLVPGACRSEPANLSYYADGHPRQKYPYGQVKQSAERLRPGMTRHEVLLLLGSPAERTADTWTWVPEDPSLLLPQDVLVVRFKGNRYATHEFKPIIFGRMPSS